MKLNNRFIFGILSLVLAAVIAFVALPTIARQTNGKTEIVRITQPVLKGEKITSDNAEVVEVGGYNLPSNVAHSMEDVEGLYVTADLAAGDYILTSKVSTVPVSSDVALNDIVVCRKGELRVIHFRLYVNGALLNSYEADGIIISTPTGSTAYNLSAGGPIVEPTASLIVITPICSHALNTSSIVLSPEDEIVVEIGKGRDNAEQEVIVSFDGADTRVLRTGERVEIRRAKASTKFIKLSKVSFLETLRRKMKGN